MVSQLTMCNYKLRSDNRVGKDMEENFDDEQCEPVLLFGSFQHQITSALCTPRVMYLSLHLNAHV